MSECLAIASDAESIEIDDAVLVFYGNLIHLLDGSAAEIWKLVDGSTRAGDVTALLSARHPESSNVPGDVLRFVTDLVDRGLVVRGSNPTGNGIHIPEHVAWTVDSDGTVVIADLRTGTRQSLSTTASRTWTWTLDGASRETLLARLAEEFSDAPPNFADDVDQLVNWLVEQNLLEWSPGHW